MRPTGPDDWPTGWPPAYDPSLIDRHCSICGHWYRREHPPVGCAVIHPPGSCCHLGERKITRAAGDDLLAEVTGVKQ